MSVAPTPAVHPGVAPEWANALLLELGLIRHRMDELAAFAGGETIAIPYRVRLTSAGPWEWQPDSLRVYGAVKIDNWNPVPLEVGFSAGGGQDQARSDERVPPNAGRIITHPFQALSIGVDPVYAAALPVVVYVTVYSRPQPPTTYQLDTGAARRPVSPGQYALAVTNAAVVSLAPPAGAATASVAVEGAAIRFTVDGETPSSTNGLLAEPGDVIALDTAPALFRAIAVSAAAATLQVTFYSG